MEANLPKVGRYCLHVTPADRIELILREGLIPQVGENSKQIETSPAVFMFPTWDDMEDATWLFDDWPHESEPALLAVNVVGLDLESDVAYEVKCTSHIMPARIAVLAESEHGWDRVRAVFETSLAGK